MPKHITTGKDGKRYYGKGTKGGKAPELPEANASETIRHLAEIIEPLSTRTYKSGTNSTIKLTVGHWITIEKANGTRRAGVIEMLEPHRIAIVDKGWVYLKDAIIIESHEIRDRR